MKRRIAEIKLKRGTVNERKLKWNVMYIVPAGEESVLERMCTKSAGIVLPPNAALLTKIRDEVYSSLKEYKFIGQTRDSEKNVKLKIETPDVSEQRVLPEWLHEDCSVMVPILGRWNKTLEAMSPAYLVGDKHLECVENQTRYGRRHSAEDFPEDAYIQTPAGKLQPICLACTNSLKGMLGECKLGGRSCIDSIVFHSIPSFKNRYESGEPTSETDYHDLESSDPNLTAAEQDAKKAAGEPEPIITDLDF